MSAIRRNPSTIGAFMSDDPDQQAHIAAITFESLEQDRYDRETSFICRHLWVFYSIGMALTFGCVAAIVTLGSSVTSYATPSGERLLTVLMVSAICGLLMLLITFARPGMKNARAAWKNVALVLALATVLIVPITLIGHEVLLALFS